MEVSRKCSKIRPLLAQHNTLFTELQRDILLLKRYCGFPLRHPQSLLLPSLSSPRLSLQSRAASTPNSGSLLGSSLIATEESSTPAASPTLRARSPFLHRQRNVSFANPDPFIKLILDGVSRKVSRRANILGRTLMCGCTCCAIADDIGGVSVG